MNYKLHVLIGQTQHYHVADIFKHQAQIVFRLRSLYLSGLYL